MSVVYCHECDKHIDTDFEAEHFIYGTEKHDPVMDDKWTLKDFETLPGVYVDADGLRISKEEAQEEVNFKNRRYAK